MTRRALFVALALLLPAAVSAQHAPRAVRAVGVDEGPVMAVIRRVAARLRSTRYVHNTRIVDSTSIPHGDDTRPRAHRSGFGYGTIVVHYDDPRGEATGYGWYGLPTRLDFRTHLALGRAVR